MTAITVGIFTLLMVWYINHTEGRLLKLEREIRIIKDGEIQ